MKRILKWLVIIGGVVFVLIVAAVIIIPQLVDVKTYKPVIEEKVALATGRSFFIGEDMDFSVFPWVGVKVTDVRLGNPQGFSEEQMVAVKKFEIRLKVLPLLSRKIEVKTFVLDQPVIHLEKLKNGTANWTGIGPKTGKEAKAAPKTEPSPKGRGLPVSELKVDNFAVTNGRLTYVDQAADIKKQVTDLNLNLTGISLDRPVHIQFNAGLDGKPISLSGTAGPVGNPPGKGEMALDLALNLLNELDAKIQGSVTNPATTPDLDILLDVSSFSPRKLMAGLGRPFPMKPRDPGVLEKVAVKARISGNTGQLSLSDGVLVLDDSKLAFSATAKEFEKPNLAFDLDLDAIDLDRYLPEPTSKDKKATPAKTASPGKKKKTDYTPLRKLVMDGTIKVGRLKASNVSMQDVVVHILTKSGVITVDPMDVKLYKGGVDSKLVLDVRKNEPQTHVILSAQGIQAGPMITDMMKKDLIEGRLQSSLDVRFTGDAPDRIKRTLSGKGQLLFNDGAIVGIDLADSVRNVKSRLGVGETPTEKPRTDFAELIVPFTAASGLVTIDGTGLTSPLLRVLMGGKVNLPKEVLDVRVEPKFVATLKGQGDTKQRSGLMVPVLITGTFSSPKIRPDLKGMIGSGKGLDVESLKKQVLGTEKDPKAGIETQKETIKNQLKNLFPGITD